MSTVAIVYDTIISIIMITFVVVISSYIHKRKEEIVKLNHIEDEMSDLMLHHRK